jgi:amidase
MMSVQGPIARQVKDVRLALAAMAAGDPRDPLWMPAPLDGPRPEGPIRVAVTQTPAGLPCDPAVAAAIDRAAGVLSDAGYAVEACDPPEVARAASCWRALLAIEVRLTMAPAIREHGSASINVMLDSFLAGGQDVDLAGYIDLQRERLHLIRLWAHFQADYPIILAPVSQDPPFPQNDDQSGDARLAVLTDAQCMQYVVNLLGLPAAAVPTGLHDGMAMGVQLIGPRMREDMCLDAAQVIEDSVGVLARKLWAV